MHNYVADIHKSMYHLQKCLQFNSPFMSYVFKCFWLHNLNNFTFIYLYNTHLDTDLFCRQFIVCQHIQYPHAYNKNKNKIKIEIERQVSTKFNLIKFIV